ncbi:MAG: AAA family ATPase [Bacteroidetes bacterium]|nr:AAA family ATPase [Bacteroidota bacterium]
MVSIAEIGFTNFRVFEKDTDFKLSPITIITGPNNSGKSSILKSILLFQDNLKRKGLLGGLDDLSFEAPYHHLGDFDSTISNPKNKEISFCFKIDSLIFKLDYIANTTIKGNAKLSLFGIYHELDNNWLFYLNNSEGTCYVDIYHFKKIIDDLAISNDSRIKSFHHKARYHGDLPIFEFEFENLNSRLTNEEIIDIENNILKDKTFFPLGGNPERYTDSIKWLLEQGLWEIELVYNIENGSYAIIEKLKKKYHLKKIKETYNGMLLCKSISEYIENQIKNLELAIESFEHLSSSRGNQSRAHITGTSELSSILSIIQKKTIISKEKEQFLNKWLLNFGIITNKQKLVIKWEAETVLIALIVDKVTGKKIRNISDFGFGASQLIAIILKIITLDKFRIPRKTLYIEEPEANLHPNYQSKLADLFIEARIKFGINFILETHSEYLIRRFQLNVASKAIDNEDIIIHYLAGKGIKPKAIEIDKSGKLSDDFGSGFVDEATNIIFQLWDIQAQN